MRQTPHPKFVTEMLTGVLRAIGRPYDANRIFKRTRDEVLWDNALKPWRRSPRWLLLRVALQTSLITKAGINNIHTRYKMFMLLVMSHILDLALRASLRGELLFVMAAKISRRLLK